MKLRMAAMLAVVMTVTQAWSPALRADQRKFTEVVTVKGTAVNASGGYALTFGSPVSLPGVSLGSGTYVFRHSTADTMQISNASGTPYGMFLTIPTHRDMPTDRYAIVFGPGARDDAPKRILAIFAPGERTGRQFIYAER